MNLTEYIESVKQYPIPQNPMGQIRLFAKELAGGAAFQVMKQFKLTYINGGGDLQHFLICRY